MALDYTSSTDAFVEMSEGNYSSSDYPAMATMITAASRLIDSEMGRWPGFFYPSTSDETRYYDESEKKKKRIDKFAASHPYRSQNKAAQARRITRFGRPPITWPG